MEKRYFLDLGDLISNLFYILMENGIDVKQVSYHQLIDFKEILEKEALKSEIELSFRLSRDDTAKFFCYTKDTFEEVNDDLISIKEGVTPIHLNWDFRSSLPLDVLLLTSKESVVSSTLKMMGYEKPVEKVPHSIDYYINILNKKINEYASKMEFEKCIELRDKLYNLQFIMKVTESRRVQQNGNNQRVKIEKSNN